MTTLSSPRLIGIAALSLIAGLAQAQYKVIGPDGKVTYTDKPPVADNVKVQTINVGSTAAAAQDLSGLPQELRQVVSRFPVVFYAGNGCNACDAGRNLLNVRGIPYSEKRVESQADIDALQRLSGSRSLPLLTIGNQKIKSLSVNEWQSYLDAAGYPKESKLPANYRRPQPSPITPPQAAAPAAAEGNEVVAPKSVGGPEIKF